MIGFIFYISFSALCKKYGAVSGKTCVVSAAENQEWYNAVILAFLVPGFNHGGRRPGFQPVQSKLKELFYMELKHCRANHNKLKLLFKDKTLTVRQVIEIKMSSKVFLWCTPKSCSTAFERAIQQAKDVDVCHELYGKAHVFGPDRLVALSKLDD